MTIEKALRSEISLQVGSDLIEKILTDNDLDGAGAYTKADAPAINAAAIQALLAVRSVTNVSEGGFSISIDQSAVESRLAYLCSKSGGRVAIDDLKLTVKPKVRAKTLW